MLVSEELKKVMEYAGDEALRTGYPSIFPEHLLMGMLRDGANSGAGDVRGCGVSPAELLRSVDRLIFRDEALPFSFRSKIRLASESRSLLRDMMLIALKDGDQEATARHLLRALLESGNGNCSRVFQEAGVSSEKLDALAEAGKGAEEIPRTESVKSPQSTERQEPANVDEDLVAALSEQIEACQAFFRGKNRTPS